MSLYLLAIIFAVTAARSASMPRGWQPPGWWARQAACIRSHEGWWTADTGNGYYGAYQFLASTWRAAGGVGYPNQASPLEQTFRAYVVWRRDGGWSEWGTRGLCGL